jgi:hypothetical protein
MIETDTSFSASSFHHTDVPWVQTETNNREMDSVSLSHNTSNTTLRGGDALQTGHRDKMTKCGLQLQPGSHIEYRSVSLSEKEWYSVGIPGFVKDRFLTPSNLVVPRSTRRNSLNVSLRQSTLPGVHLEPTGPTLRDECIFPYPWWYFTCGDIHSWQGHFYRLVWHIEIERNQDWDQRVAGTHACST